MALAYAEFYRDDKHKTLAVEKKFSLPVYDIDTKEILKDSNGEIVYYNGIIDHIIEDNGLIYFCDHKVITKLDDAYWEELGTNPQLTRYWMAGRQNGREPAGFMWDVVIKPGISPKDLTKKAIKEMEDTGTYCGLPCVYDGEEKESPKQYGVRVLSEYLENPQKYFHRKIFRRTAEDIVEYLRELKWDLQEMEQAREDERLQRRNLNSCKSFGSLCEFHALCAGKAQPDIAYRQKGPKLYDIEMHGTSESEVSTYHSCGRKWKHRYVDRIEPLMKPYSQPLEIGSLMHEAFEILLTNRMVEGESYEFGRKEDG